MERLEMKEADGWYGSEMETDKFDMQDPGEGAAMLLRKIEVVYHPGQKTKPKKKDILTKDFIKSIEVKCWADNLEVIALPKIHFTKKGFTIFVPCKAKKGHIIPWENQNVLNMTLNERLAEEAHDNG